MLTLGLPHLTYSRLSRRWSCWQSRRLSIAGPLRLAPSGVPLSIAHPCNARKPCKLVFDRPENRRKRAHIGS